MLDAHYTATMTGCNYSHSVDVPVDVTVYIVRRYPIEVTIMYYCLLLLQILISSTTSYTVDQLWSLTTHFWDNLLYPANTAHINPNDTSIFSDNVLPPLPL